MTSLPTIISVDYIRNETYHTICKSDIEFHQVRVIKGSILRAKQYHLLWTIPKMNTS